MNIHDLNFVELRSKKNGNIYYALDIEITPDYTKRVFLEKAEVALIKTISSNS